MAIHRKTWIYLVSSICSSVVHGCVKLSLFTRILIPNSSRNVQLPLGKDVVSCSSLRFVSLSKASINRLQCCLNTRKAPHQQMASAYLKLWKTLKTWRYLSFLRELCSRRLVALNLTQLQDPTPALPRYLQINNHDAEQREAAPPQLLGQRSVNRVREPKRWK